MFLNDGNSRNFFKGIIVLLVIIISGCASGGVHYKIFDIDPAKYADASLSMKEANEMLVGLNIETNYIRSRNEHTADTSYKPIYGQITRIVNNVAFYDFQGEVIDEVTFDSEPAYKKFITRTRYHKETLHSNVDLNKVTKIKKMEYSDSAYLYNGNDKIAEIRFNFRNDIPIKDGPGPYRFIAALIALCPNLDK